MCQAAVRLDRLHETVEGQVLVCQRIQGQLAYPAQQPVERHTRFDP
jgi:hypothetical protein